MGVSGAVARRGGEALGVGRGEVLLVVYFGSEESRFSLGKLQGSLAMTHS